MKQLLIILVILMTLSANTDTKTHAQPNVYFARANFTDVTVYHSPHEEAIFSPSHDRIYKNSVQRLEVFDEKWARLYPDNGLYSPWYQYDRYPDVYVKRENFTPITNFDPINILPNTQNDDKMVIVIRNFYPELLLIEGDQIVAKIPTCVGGYYNNSTTPLGFFHADAAWTTRHMNTLPGVPFTIYYSQHLGTAFHGAPWRNWDQMTRGCYGSAGCINLPTPGIWDVYWNGDQLGFDHFFFNWVRTNLAFDPYTEEPYSVEWTQEGWYEGQASLRVYIVTNIINIWQYAPHPTNQGRLSSWQPIINQYYQLEGFWRLPNDQEITDHLDLPQAE